MNGNLTFEQPVLGAGTQIAVDDTTNFTGFISAIDEAGASLGTFSAPGTSSLALDNSALFLGVVSDKPNIKRLVFNTSVSERAIGINSLSITAAQVPEPSSIIALCLLNLGLLSSRHKE